MAIQSREELLTELRATFSAWDRAIVSFDDRQFNLVPFEGSWTPSQVTQHIIMAVSDLPDKHTKSTDRPIDQLVHPLAGIFLNFSIKMQSPDVICPGKEPHQKAEQLAKCIGIQEHLEQAIHTTDLSLTCLDFELPGLGALTRYEWVKMFTFHIQRHTRQLQNIQAALEEAK